MNIKEAKEEIGKEIVIAGYVKEFRNLGRIKFVILRDWKDEIQVVLKNEDISLNREDVVEFKGKSQENKIAPGGIEFIPETYTILSRVERKLPVDTLDLVKSELDTRLTYRFIDLRKRKIENIFIKKSHILRAFRNFLYKNEFIEINPPIIVGAATEGGADVFEIKYFERKAYLAQSPQLYKQMAIVGGLEKVFMTIPVFRAEKHNTTTHLNEILQMDVEMAYADDKKAMKLLEETFKYILKQVVKKDVNVYYHTYTELVDLLNENNIKKEWGEDFTKEEEKKLNEILNEEAYIIYEWPTLARAFYSMPKENEPELCKAYDLIYKGLEISSGAQRIHIPSLLEEQLRKRGLNPIDFSFYIDAFRFGAPPHAGWSIGLERITMKMLDLDNIREASLFPRDRTRITP